MKRREFIRLLGGRLVQRLKPRQDCRHSFSPPAGRCTLSADTRINYAEAAKSAIPIPPRMPLLGSFWPHLLFSTNRITPARTSLLVNSLVREYVS